MPVRIKGYDCFGQNIVIVGMAQQGKSYLLEALIKQELQGWRDKQGDHLINWWLFDPRHQHRNPLLGAKIVNSLDELQEGKIIFQPPEDAKGLFEEFCMASRQIWNLVIIVEEVQLFCTKASMPYHFNEIVTTGCNHGNTYIALTQRPAEIHNAILSNSHHRIIFRLQWLTDKDVIGKWTGDLEAVKWLSTAPLYSYLYHHYLDEKPERCKPI